MAGDSRWQAVFAVRGRGTLGRRVRSCLTTGQSVGMAGPKQKPNPAKKTPPSHGTFGGITGLATILIAGLSIVAYIMLNPVRSY